MNPPPPGQYSPDGRSWWNGQQWVPVAGAPPPIPVSIVSPPGNSFSRAFFGGLGRMSAGCVFACVVVPVLLVILFAGCGAVLQSAEKGMPTPRPVPTQQSVFP
jgi:hypothetical protein